MHKKINVKNLLQSIPKANKLPRYKEILSICNQLKNDPRFVVATIGKSKKGKNIPYIKFGTGNTKALFVGYPHPNEPIGGLTCISLLKLLKKNNPELINADVEWHILPCMDPDGAILNEGWSTKKFSLNNFMEYYFRQVPSQQVEWSFPIEYKKYSFRSPTLETQFLMKICQDVKPDFCFSLHNAMIGGAFFYINRDFGNPLYKNLYKLLKLNKIPLHLGEAEIAFSKIFSPAIYECLSVENFYNHLETLRPDPENAINRGAGTCEYLSKLNNKSVSFYCELPYVKHPDISSNQKSLENRGKLLLRNAQEYTYLMNTLGIIWSEVKNLVNKVSPFYDEPKDKFENWILTDGDYNNILNNKSLFESNATKGQALDLNLMTYYHLCNNRSMVRLIQETIKSRKKYNQKDKEILKRNLVKSNALYAELMDDISRRINFKTLETIDLTTLVKVQLGAGMEVLNAVIKSKLPD